MRAAMGIATRRDEGTVMTHDRATTPAMVPARDRGNVTDLLVDRCRAAPDHPAFDVPNMAGGWETRTTGEFTAEVRAIAAGLVGAGVSPGDTVLIMAATQYRWAVADFAALVAGAVVVPVYDDAPDARLAAVIADARPVAAFAGDAGIAARIAAAAGELGAALSTWTLDDLAPLRALGAGIDDRTLEERRRRAGPDDLATIVYTSGTTGAPRGALITHRNLVEQVRNTAAAYGEVVHERGSTVLFLPLTHVLGRALQLICIANGMRIAHLADPKRVVAALPELRPTFLVVVPRVLERILRAGGAAASSKRLGALWRSAMRTAERWADHLAARDADPTARPAPGLATLRALHERLFYRRLRAALGGRLEWLLSGAATLPPDLARRFRGIGIPVIEGYGLTETTAPLTGGRPGSLVPGSVGTPLPGNEVRISATGEVLARGVGVFAGYRDPAATAAAFDADGWFRTGDLGALDDRGALRLHGRRAHRIVTSTGRTLSPEPWERAVAHDPLIAHAALVGTDRPYPVALLVLDPEQLPGDVDPEPAPGLPGIAAVTAPEVRARLDAAVARANAAVPRAERAQYWRAVRLLPAHETDYVTPTLKLRRAALLGAAAPLIDAMYARPGAAHRTP